MGRGKHQVLLSLPHLQLHGIWSISIFTSSRLSQLDPAEGSICLSRDARGGSLDALT